MKSVPLLLVASLMEGGANAIAEAVLSLGALISSDEGRGKRPPGT